MFSDARVVSSIGALIYGAVSLFSNIIFISNVPFPYYIISLFPQAGLSVSISLNVLKPDDPPAVDRGTINWIIAFDFVFFLILYVYLDQVKDDNGVRKPLLFFLDVFKFKKKNAIRQDKNALGLSINLNQNQEELSAHLNIDGNNEADFSSAVYHEAIPGAQNLIKAVQVQNLTKNFGMFTAVDNISFPIYQGQIFCLLGHNGAGKTTTIKMLTGLLDNDSGKIIYDGKDFINNFEEIRTKIGICTQQDILFEKLKVCEHLELIAKLRHISDDRIPAAVEEALHKVNLVNERDKFAEDLSGGNKRKLSLAMAVLGQTKVVFLDEPTSGMDPQNRRVMLPKYEKATLEEFLNLKPRLQTVISNVIPAAKFDEQTANDVLKCSLPFITQKDFPRLFAELENFEEIRINVEINTLEDVFVNVGLNEDQLLQGKQPVSADIDLTVEPPACLRERPTYDFFYQTFALGKRRAYILCRSGRNILLMILPLALILIGVLSSFGIDDETIRFLYFETVITISFSLNTGAYISLPVYEKEDKLKYLMNVMGLRNLPYWIGNIVVDFVAITLVNLIVFGLYAWLHSGLTGVAENNITFPSPWEFLAVVIPHGLCLVTIGYAYSFMFDRALSAIKYFPLFYFFVLFMITTEVANMNHPSEVHHLVLGSIVSIVCPTSLFLIFMTGQTSDMGLGVVVLFEIVYAVFYFVLAVLMESRKDYRRRKNVAQGYTASENRSIPIDHNDINNEKNRTLQAEQDPIRVMG